MSDAPRPTGKRSRSWAERALRAEELLAEQSPSEEMLRLYVALLQLQEPVYHRARTATWFTQVTSDNDAVLPALQLNRLPSGELAAPFAEFLGAVALIATDTLQPIADSIASAGRAVQERLLSLFLAQGDLQDLSESLNCDARPLEFCARAFLEPIAMALADQWEGDVTTWRRTVCPLCGQAPQVSAIHDEPDAKGRRMLVCCLCASPWAYPRSTCPHCGETDPEKLVYHEADAMPHIRIDECRACQTYLKSVDFRAKGTAVPVVEDLASVELDVWCSERGLVKIQRNLLGM